MSYNIDKFKVKKLENLRIPIKPLYDEKILKKDWLPNQPRFVGINGDKIVIDGGAEGFEIIGTQENEYILVDKITLYGEGSGHFRDIFDHALKQSTGILEVVMIWEGGDSITKMTVENGKLTEVNVEL